MALGSKIRRFTNWFIPFILLITYLPAIFQDPTKFVGELSPSEEGRDPAEIWENSPPTTRGLGPQLAGWCFCWVTCMLTFLIGSPDEKTHILLARSNAITMLVVWPIIWYGGMLPREDYKPIAFESYLYSMTIGETVMGIVYLCTGWFIPAAEDASDEKEKST